MIAFFANLFGYLLNFLYNFVQNYGLAIILFSVVIKIIMLPLTINQQKTMKKNMKLQEKMRALQVKHKNNPEKLNQEMIELYKSENMSPFSGCLSSIAQIILLFAVFYLVRSPLTYMKKVDINLISEYTTEIQENAEEKSAYTEIQIIREKGEENPEVYINMNFLGLDLSKVPGGDFSDFKVYIIPALYVISSAADPYSMIEYTAIQPVDFPLDNIPNLTNYQFKLYDENNNDLKLLENATPDFSVKLAIKRKKRI
jgi:YidC/Oxa1 family membrane protein insertase